MDQQRKCWLLNEKPATITRRVVEIAGGWQVVLLCVRQNRGN